MERVKARKEFEKQLTQEHAPLEYSMAENLRPLAELEAERQKTRHTISGCLGRTIRVPSSLPQLSIYDMSDVHTNKGSVTSKTLQHKCY
jgi:hypothetical protein